jgi:hypothetical protein
MSDEVDKARHKTLASVLEDLARDTDGATGAHREKLVGVMQVWVAALCKDLKLCGEDVSNFRAKWFNQPGYVAEIARGVQV